MTGPDSARIPDGRRRTKRVLAVTGALALLATAIVYGTKVVNPDGPNYCWDSWRGAHVPWSDSADDGDEGFKVESDKRPSASEAQGACEIHFTLNRGRTLDPTPPSRVTLAYGQLPETEEDRRGWLASYVHGGAVPLPNGVPGLVDTRRGMVVLPRACEVKGEPTVVTLAADGAWNDDNEDHKGWDPNRRQLTRLLLLAAQKGMEHTGCADGEKLTTDGAFLGEPADAPSGVDELCALPGMPRAENVLSALRTKWDRGLGVPRAADHVCSYRVPPPAGDSSATDTEGLVMVATSQPRLRAVLLAVAGQQRGKRLPGWGDRDTPATVHEGREAVVARAVCTGRSGTSEKADTVFAVVRSHQTRTSPTKVPPSDVLPRYVKSMQGPMGCGEVAPRD